MNVNGVSIMSLLGLTLPVRVKGNGSQWTVTNVPIQMTDVFYTVNHM